MKMVIGQSMLTNYRQLEPGEQVTYGDLFKIPGWTDWEECNCFGHIVDKDNCSNFARKIAMTTMPRIDMRRLHNELDPEIYQLVTRIVDQKSWRLRRTRPRICKNIDGTLTHHCACATYIWRMVAFTVSPVQSHQCMPIAAYYYLPKSIGHLEVRELVKKLDIIVDQVIDVVPCTEWHGVIRWIKTESI